MVRQHAVEQRDRDESNDRKRYEHAVKDHALLEVRPRVEHHEVLEDHQEHELCQMHVLQLEHREAEQEPDADRESGGPLPLLLLDAVREAQQSLCVLCPAVARRNPAAAEQTAAHCQQHREQAFHHDKYHQKHSLFTKSAVCCPYPSKNERKGQNLREQIVLDMIY